MAAVSHRGGGRRRTINEINMVPFIDVMLVLLIIFMVSAPLITTGKIDVPTVGSNSTDPKPDHVVELTVGNDKSYRLKLDGKEESKPLPLNKLSERILQIQSLSKKKTPVLISADREIKYQAVVDVMATLRAGGVQHVGLLVKSGN